MRFPRGVLVGGVVCALLPGAAVAQDRSIFSALDVGGRVVASDGAPARGTLSGDDLIATGGRRIQVWRLDSSVGDALQVDLRSGDFDPYLYVVGPGLGEGLSDDDGGDGLNARLCLVVDEPGEYRVVASSLSSATGGYTLEVRARPGVSDGPCPEEATAAPADVQDLADLPTEGRTLAVGVAGEGSLSASDPTVLGAPAQAWALEGVAGESRTVDLESDDFDAYLMVEGPGLDEWLYDDDGAGRCNSRITIEFPATGTYRVVASTLGSGAGAYRLVATATPGPRSEESCVPPSRDEPEYDVEDVALAGSLGWEETREGTLSGDEVEYQGRRMQAWTLEADAAGRVAVEMRSSDFDSYLYLAGPGFDEPASNDDGAGNLNARLCVELPSAGTYRVLAGAYSGGDAGDRYTLRASRTAAPNDCAELGFEVSAGAVADMLTRLPTQGRTLALGDEVEGRLDPATDPRHPESDDVIQPWSFQGEADRTVYVDVISDEFDTVLYAAGVGIDGVLFIDDADAGCNSRMSITPSASGTIVLLPGAYSDEGEGAFRLRASEDPPELEDNGCAFGDADSPPAVADADALAGVSAGDDRPIELATVVEGTLGADDQRRATGEPAQAWTLQVRAGEELEITLASDDFDPMLYVDGPSISPPLMDDDGAGDLDSRITYTPPEDGVLRLVVSSYTSDASGSFELRIVRRLP
ncbi:MAG: hypothetical protein AB7T31_01245 [Gemmatimonadales bacterium]